MKTVVSVKVEKELWESAKDLAEELGMPLSTIIGANLREFVRSRKVVFAAEPQLRPEIEALLQEVRTERGSDKNLSPRFKDAKAAMDWLKE
jgi:antitoxin component of RelBE/YafQ-DinJ toxin-antitoxin module